MSDADAKPDAVRLLIVDDDFLFAQMLPRLLLRTIASPSLDVTSSRSASDAMRTLSSRPFDVILCDFDLRTPLTGIDVLQHASQLDPRPVRILMSGHAPREIHAPEGTFDQLIEKPMTLREMPGLLAPIFRERLSVDLIGHDDARIGA